MFCSHRPGIVSVNGFYQCPLCFQMVRHPWAVEPTVKDCLTAQPETGIQRQAREMADWPKRMGVDVKGGAR